MNQMQALQLDHRTRHGEATYRPPVLLPIRNGIPVLNAEVTVPPRFKFFTEQLEKAHFKPILFEDDRAVYVRRISTPSQFTDHLLTLDLTKSGPRWILESKNEVLCESGKRKDWKALGIHPLKSVTDLRMFLDFFGGLR